LHYRFVCEAIMHLFSGLAIAIISAWIGVHVNPAAAQSFEVIIPKANAAEPKGTIKPVPQTQQPGPQTQQPSEAKPARRAEGRSGTRSIKPSFTGKGSYYSYRTGKAANRNLRTAAHRSLPFGTRIRVKY
jgi:rare lipoprotein A (peptidoglycan hydrolase)